MDYTEFGFIRAAAVAPVVSLAEPAANARTHIEHISALEAEGVTLQTRRESPGTAAAGPD